MVHLPVGAALDRTDSVHRADLFFRLVAQPAFLRQRGRLYLF